MGGKGFSITPHLLISLDYQYILIIYMELLQELSEVTLNWLI